MFKFCDLAREMYTVGSLAVRKSTLPPQRTALPNNGGISKVDKQPRPSVLGGELVEMVHNIIHNIF